MITPPSRPHRRPAGRITRLRLAAGLAAGLVAGLAVLAVVAFFTIVPGLVDRRLNAPPPPAEAPVPPAAIALHRRLRVADLHADTLLWGRDLNRDGTTGHADVPRLLRGGVVLQGFSVVTKVPAGANIERTTDRADMVSLLAVAAGWPRAAWTDRRERERFLASRLQQAADTSAGRLVVVRTRDDLQHVLDARDAGRSVLGGILTLEGTHALDGGLDRLDDLARIGYRVIAPTHFLDTEVAGSAHGIGRGGLTALGRRWLARMEALGLTVDLAHASAATIDDVLAAASRPVLVTHTGVRATCDNPRNLDDRQLRAIARAGGLIGIGFWVEAVCAQRVEAIADAIVHAIAVAGVDHVALGSDFDGTVPVAIDAPRLPELTAALMARGLDEPRIAKVMGENTIRFFARALPAHGSGPAR